MLIPINSAQRAKNCSGRIFMMASVLGLNIQLSLPGKNILWKMVNALLKSVAIKTASTEKIMPGIIPP